MNGLIKKILTIFTVLYISIFLVNLTWERFETKRINKIIQINLLEALDRFKLTNKVQGLNNYTIPNHQDFSGFNYIFDKYKIYPLSTFSNKKIILCNEYGENIFIKTDKFGFRNNNSDYKNNEYYFIGDSFGLGVCHSNEDFFLNNLSKNLLNLSQAGTSVLTQSIILREYSEISEDTKLFWFLYLGNDFDELINEIKNPYLKKYIHNWKFSQNLKNKNILKDKALHEINFHIKKIKKKDIENSFKNKKYHNLSQLLKINFTRGKIYTKFFNLYSDKIINEYLKIIINTKKNLNINDLTIIILPDPRVFNYNKYRKLYKIDYIKDQLNNNNIKTFDLANFFEKQYNFFDFFYSFNSHFTKKSNKIIRERILYCINKYQDLDCK